MLTNDGPPMPYISGSEEKKPCRTQRSRSTPGLIPFQDRKDRTKKRQNKSPTVNSSNAELLPEQTQMQTEIQAPTLHTANRPSGVSNGAKVRQRSQTICNQNFTNNGIKDKMSKLLHKQKKKVKETEDIVVERSASKPIPKECNGESVGFFDARSQSQAKKVIKLETGIEKALRVLQELIETEETYLNDLKRLYSVYFVGLTSILSTSDHKIVFLNLKELISLTEMLFVKLKTVPVSNPFQIGTVFIEVQGDLSREYGTFCKGNEKANKTIHELQKRDNKLKDFLYHAKQTDDKLIGFKDYLIKPVQRICRYPLLLQEIQRNEPFPSKNLKNAIEYTRNILNTINKKVADQEKISHLLKICGKTSIDDFVGKDFDGTVLDDRTLFCFKQWPRNKTKPKALYGIITPTHFLFSYPSSSLKRKVALKSHPLEFILANEQAGNYVVEVSFIKAQKKLFFEFDIYINQVDWCHTISIACDKARAKKDPLTQQIIEQEQKKLDELLDRTILNPHSVSNESPIKPSSNSLDILSLFEQTSKV